MVAKVPPPPLKEKKKEKKRKNKKQPEAFLSTVLIIFITVQYDDLFKAAHMVKKENNSNRFGSMPK